MRLTWEGLGELLVELGEAVGSWDLTSPVVRTASVTAPSRWRWYVASATGGTRSAKVLDLRRLPRT